MKLNLIQNSNPRPKTAQEKTQKYTNLPTPSVVWETVCKYVTKALSFFSLVILLMSSVCISFYWLKLLWQTSLWKLMQTELISKITNEKKD